METSFYLDPELEFLIGALKTVDDKKNMSDLSRIIDTGTVNWERVSKLASLHKIRPLVLKSLEKMDNLERIPKNFRKELQDQCRQIILRNLLNQQELLVLLQQLKQENITAIPYKGNVLSKLLYGCNHLRESADIDFFIYRKEIFKLKSFFMSKNILPEFHLTPEAEQHLLETNCELNYSYRKESGHLIHLEPHHKSSHALEAIDLVLEDLDDKLIGLIVDGSAITVFDINATLLLVTLNHGITERWERLKYIFDFHRLITLHSDKVDWNWFINNLKKHDVSATFYSGLILVNSLFQTPIPDPIKQHLNNAKAIELAKERINFLSTFEEVSLITELKTFWYRIKARDSITNKLKILCRTIILPTNKDYLLFEKSTNRGYRWGVFRPLRIFYTYFLPRFRVFK